MRNGEIFVPMLFKMAIAGTKSRQVAYTIGRDEVLEAKHQVAASGETTYKLRMVADAGQPAGNASPAANDQATTGLEFIPEQRIFGSKVLLTPGTQVRDASWYRLHLQGDSTLAEYAFNYDRKEKRPALQDARTICRGPSHQHENFVGKRRGELWTGRR